MKNQKIYSYDVFYEIFDSIAQATVKGKNKKDAIENFKEVFGKHKITAIQRLTI